MEAQLRECPERLQEMAAYFSLVFREVTGLEATVTRVSDKVAGESGVHPAKRAFDCRDEHGGKRICTPEQVAAICDAMNRAFPRRDRRLTCIHHSFQGGPAHFHVQVESLPVRTAILARGSS